MGVGTPKSRLLGFYCQNDTSEEEEEEEEDTCSKARSKAQEEGAPCSKAHLLRALRLK